MTEREWLACADAPQQMLSQLRWPLSGRKLRLLLCGCCRRFSHLLSDPRILPAVEVCERFVDRRRATREALKAANAASHAACLDLENRPPFESGLALCAMLATLERITSRDVGGVAMIALRSEMGDAWPRAQCELLRDLFGNPFHPAAIDASWLTWQGGLVVRLARAAYEERGLPAGTLDNTRLAVLADALEEAGCTDGQILGHLRSGGDHVRGCWVVDLMLGES
jgi:hypothetical protein